MQIKPEFVRPTLAAIAVAALCALSPAASHAQGAPPPIPQQPPGLILNGVPQPPGMVVNGKPVAYNISDVAAAKVSLSVENGDWDDFVKAIGGSTPKLLSIETRGGTPFRASLKVSNMPIEDVLRGLAGFSHCNLYLLPGKFLVTPERLLRPAEKAQLIQDAPVPTAIPQKKNENPFKSENPFKN